MDNETIFCDLTSREREILRAIAEGLTADRERPKVIDKDLRIYSITTAATNADPTHCGFYDAENHRFILFRDKPGFESRLEQIRFFLTTEDTEIPALDEEGVWLLRNIQSLWIYLQKRDGLILAEKMYRSFLPGVSDRNATPIWCNFVAEAVAEKYKPETALQMMFVYGYACGKRYERQRKKGRKNNGL